MRRIIIAILMLTCTACLNAHAGKTVKYTADYYEMWKHKHMDTEVKIHVAYVINRSKSFSISKEYMMFYAHTAYKSDWGGAIYVAVPLDRVNYFLKKFGNDAEYDRGEIETDSVRGTLKETENGTLYIIYRS